MSKEKDQWGSRWGFIAATIGMAVGTGNIWRFPRVAATNGGGSFIIAWSVALLVWSIPLLIGEMVLGRKTRLGTIGAFRDFIGKKFTWLGAWIALVCVLIMSYYSVVMGWTIKYFTLALSGKLVGDTEIIWNQFIGNPIQTSFLHFISIAIAGIIIYRGIQGGIEKTSKILIPSLFIILIITAVRAVTLPGAKEGLEYLFNPNFSDLLNARIWLEAFTQSAWSTGAGWGFIITYSIYTKEKSDVGLNCFLTGFGNNSASILAALAVVPAIFALSSSTEAANMALNSGNNGLAFIYLAKIIPDMPGGTVLAPLFFLGMALAALSSLIAMLEVAVTNLINTGISRKKATIMTTTVGFILGLPSAFSINIFENQDFVWGVGLLISGLFVSFAMIRFGTEKIRKNEINTPWNDLHIGKWWTYCIYLFPVFFIIIFGWWMYQAVSWYPNNWWNPFELYSPGTIILQFALAITLLLSLNTWLSGKVNKISRGDE